MFFTHSLLYVGRLVVKEPAYIYISLIHIQSDIFKYFTIPIENVRRVYHSDVSIKLSKTHFN